MARPSLFPFLKLPSTSCSERERERERGQKLSCSSQLCCWVGRGGSPGSCKGGFVGVYGKRWWGGGGGGTAASCGDVCEVGWAAYMKTSSRVSQTELGIIGDYSTNRQRINRSTLSIVSYWLALEMALSVCHLKTKSDDRQIELSIRTIKRYCRMIAWRNIVLTMLSIHRFKHKNSLMITQSIEV